MYRTKIAPPSSRFLVPLDEVALKRKHDVPYCAQEQSGSGTSTSSTQQSATQQSTTSVLTDNELQREMQNALGPSKPAPPAQFHALTMEGSDDEPPKPPPVVINRGVSGRQRSPRVIVSNSTTGEDRGPHVVFSRKLVLDATELDNAMLPRGEQSPAILKPPRFAEKPRPEREDKPNGKPNVRAPPKPQGTTSQDNHELYLMSPPPSPHAHEPISVEKSVHKKSKPRRVVDEQVPETASPAPDVDADKIKRLIRIPLKRMTRAEARAENMRNAICQQSTSNKEESVPCCKCKCMNFTSSQIKSRPRIILEVSSAGTDMKKCLNNAADILGRHSDKDQSREAKKMTITCENGTDNKRQSRMTGISELLTEAAKHGRDADHNAKPSLGRSLPEPANNKVNKSTKFEDNRRPTISGSNDSSESIDNKHGREKYLAALKKFSDGNHKLGADESSNITTMPRIKIGRGKHSGRETEEKPATNTKILKGPQRKSEPPRGSTQFPRGGSQKFCDREKPELRTSVKSVGSSAVNPESGSAPRVQGQKQSPNRGPLPIQHKDSPQTYETERRRSPKEEPRKNPPGVEQQPSENVNLPAAVRAHDKAFLVPDVTERKSSTDFTAKLPHAKMEPATMTLTTSTSTTATVTKSVLRYRSTGKASSEQGSSEVTTSTETNEYYRKTWSASTTPNTLNAKDSTTFHERTSTAPNIYNAKDSMNSTLRETRLLSKSAQRSVASSSSDSKGNTSLYLKISATKVSGAGTLIFSCERQVRSQRTGRSKDLKKNRHFVKDSRDLDLDNTTDLHLVSDIFRTNKEGDSRSGLKYGSTTEPDSKEAKSTESPKSVAISDDISSRSVASTGDRSVLSLKSSTSKPKRSELATNRQATMSNSEKRGGRTDTTRNSKVSDKMLNESGRLSLPSNAEPLTSSTRVPEGSTTVVGPRKSNERSASPARLNNRPRQQLKNSEEAPKSVMLEKASRQPARLKRPNEAREVSTNNMANKPEGGGTDPLKGFPLTNAPHSNTEQIAENQGKPRNPLILPKANESERVQASTEEQDAKCSNLADLESHASTGTGPNLSGGNKSTMEKGESLKEAHVKGEEIPKSKVKSGKTSKTPEKNPHSVVKDPAGSKGVNSRRACSKKGKRSCKRSKSSKSSKKKKVCDHSKRRRSCKRSKRKNSCKHSRRSRARKSKAGKSKRKSNEKTTNSKGGSKMDSKGSDTAKKSHGKPQSSEKTNGGSKGFKKSVRMFGFSRKVGKEPKNPKSVEKNSQGPKSSQASSKSFKRSLKKWFSKKSAPSQKADSQPASARSSGHLEGGSDSVEKPQAKRSSSTPAMLSFQQAPKQKAKSPTAKANDNKEGRVVQVLGDAFTVENGETSWTGPPELKIQPSDETHNMKVMEKPRDSPPITKMSQTEIKSAESKQLHSLDSRPSSKPLVSNASPVHSQTSIPLQRYSSKRMTHPKAGDDTGVQLNYAQSEGPASKSSKASHTERQRYLRALEKLVDVISISTKNKAEDRTRELLQETLIKESTQDPANSPGVLSIESPQQGSVGHMAPVASNQENILRILAETARQGKCDIPPTSDVQESAYLNTKNSAKENLQKLSTKTSAQATPPKSEVLRTTPTVNIHPEPTSQPISKTDTGQQAPVSAFRPVERRPVKVNPPSKQKGELRIRTNRTSYPVDTNQKDSSTPTRLREYAMGSVNAPLDNLVDNFRRLERSSYSSLTFEHASAVTVRGGGYPTKYLLVCDQGHPVTEEYICRVSPHSADVDRTDALSKDPPLEDIGGQDTRTCGDSMKKKNYHVFETTPSRDRLQRVYRYSDPAAGEAAESRTRRRTRHEVVKQMPNVKLNSEKTSLNYADKYSVQSGQRSRKVSEPMNYNAREARVTSDWRPSKFLYKRRSVSIKDVRRRSVEPRRSDQESRITEITTMGTPTSMQLSDHTIFTSTRDTGTAFDGQDSDTHDTDWPSTPEECYPPSKHFSRRGTITERSDILSASDDCDDDDLATADARRDLLFKFLAKSMYCHVLQERDPNVGLLQSCAIELDQRTGLIIIPAPLDSTQWHQMWNHNLALLKARNVVVTMPAYAADSFCDRFHFRPMAVPITYIVVPPKYSLVSPKMKGVRVSLYKPKHLQNWAEWDFAALGLQRSALLQFLARNMDTFLALRGATVVGHCLVERVVDFCEEASVVRELVAENDEIAIKLLKHARKNKRLRGAKDRGLYS